MKNTLATAERGRLAIVGVAKNCGKTTTLNHLLGLRRSAPPALLSVGLDGETEDVLLGTAKPAIFVQENQWVVTARTAALRSTAQLEYVRPIGVSTPLGEVVACRVLEAGHVVLAGLRHRAEVLLALEALREEGCDAAWIDGAYGRVSGAHPEVSGAVVVSTGAIVGDDVDAVVRRTEDLISRLTLSPVSDPLLGEALTKARVECRALIVDSEQGIVPLPSASALTGLRRSRTLWQKSTVAFAVPGLVSDLVAEELLATGLEGVSLLISDATVLHMSARLWKRLQERWEVRVHSPIELVAISYNPTAITGGRLDAQHLEQGLLEKWGEVNIFNPLQ